MTQVKYFYPDGTLASIGFLRNSKPDGYWISFHPNGKKASEGNRVNYLLDGKWIFYDTLENISRIVEYKNGLKNGPCLNFSNGVLTDSSYYVNDEIIGRKFYFLNNQIIKVIEYKNGLEDGFAFEFDTLNNLQKIYTYRKGLLLKELRVNQKDNDGKLNGLYFELHNNYNIKLEGFYKNGRKNGMFKYYTLNGELLKYEIWENDTLVSNVKSSRLLVKRDVYFQGTLKKEKSGFYLYDSIPVGRHDFFNEKGELLNSEIFDYNGKKVAEGLFDAEGKKFGKWIEYHDNGIIKSIGFYKDDLPDGFWKYFDDSGRLVEQGNYKKGLITGVWEYYCENNNLRKISNFLDGKLDGITVEFDCNGDTILKVHYDYGLKNGNYFRKINNVIEQGIYKEDKRINKWITYRTDGIPISEINYDNDLANGPAYFFHSNGKIFIKGFYNEGMRGGVWNYFDQNGFKYLSVEYKNDIAIKINGKKI